MRHIYLLTPAASNRLAISPETMTDQGGSGNIIEAKTDSSDFGDVTTHRENDIPRGLLAVHDHLNGLSPIARSRAYQS